MAGTDQNQNIPTRTGLASNGLEAFTTNTVDRGHLIHEVQAAYPIASSIYDTII